MNGQKNTILNGFNCLIGPQIGETVCSQCCWETKSDVVRIGTGRVFLDGNLATSSDLCSHTQGQTPTHQRAHPYRTFLVISRTEAIKGPVKQGEVCITLCAFQVFHPHIGYWLWPRVIGRVSREFCGRAHREGHCRWGSTAILHPI